MKPRSPDYLLLGAVAVLVGVGLVMVLSASAYESEWDYGDPYFFFKRQLVWVCIGGLTAFLLSQIPYARWQRWSSFLLLASFLFLFLVLIPGIGQVARGSRRWIDLGLIQFQPSELSKLALVTYLAFRVRVERWEHLLLPFGLLGVTGALVLLQPDLGTAVSLAVAVGAMVFARGLSWSRIVLLLLASAPLGYWLVFGEEYRRERFLAFLDPWKDPLGSGYHIIQSLYALGSGGLMGVGLGMSRQKYFYLPERHTDFIFSILGEELGFFLALALVLLPFGVLAWRGYRLAMTVGDPHGAMLATGLTSLLLGQALINLGVVTGSLPVTGLPLPLVSFGGSSLVVSLAAVGILLNISRYCRC